MPQEKNKRENNKYRIAFFGTPDFSIPVLQELINMPEITVVAAVTQPDKPVGRRHDLTPPPVKSFSEKHKIAVCQPERIKSIKFEQCLRDLNLDAAIVIAYGKIIPEKYLDIPKYGWINIHGSLLPKYRGASPIQAAILKGDNKTGVSLMKIDKGLDTGDVIAMKETNITQDDNFESLHDKLSMLSAEIVKESLIEYLEGKLEATPQDNSKATETKIIKKEDGRIDWHKNAQTIGLHIRAYTPWPGSFCKYQGKTIKIHSLEEVNSDSLNLTPGEVNFIDNSLVVGCGKGSIKIKELQMEGKNSQSASEFINGNPGFKSAKLS